MTRHKSLLKRLQEQVRELRSGIETKHNELAGNTNASYALPFTQCITFVPRQPNATDVGASYYRNGDKIKVTSVDLAMKCHNSTTEPVLTWRIILFEEKFPQYGDSSTPLLSDLLDQQASTVPGYTYTGMNWDNRKRFRIIYDKNFITYRDGDGGFSPQGTMEKTVKIHLKLNRKVYFKPLATTTATGSNAQMFIRQNLLWLMVFNDSQEASFLPQVDYWHRVKFVDC